MRAGVWERREDEFSADPDLVVEVLEGGRSVRVRKYCQSPEEAEAMREGFGGEVGELAESDWTTPPPPPPPLKIRDRLLLSEASAPEEIARLEREHPGRIVLSVPRDMAFGTGEHATTATCLRMLADIAGERKWKPGGGDAVADLGCGTGVLAVAARRMGAGSVWACDFDPLAVEVARRNVERNRADGVRVEACDVLTWAPPRRYDVVLANMFSAVLIEAMPVLAEALAPGGDLVISGILREQALEVFAAGAVCGIGFRKVVRRGKWVSARGGFFRGE
jgi:ribosomal protein L11 methyltransferase